MDWNKKFKVEYDYARGWLQGERHFATAWQPLVRKLGQLMSLDGFDPARADALSELRKKAGGGSTLFRRKPATLDEGIFAAVGFAPSDGNVAPAAEVAMRAAALKLLYHTYLLNRSGDRKVWVVSLPVDFHDWPSDDINARASTQAALRTLLRSDQEIFSATQKKWLASAAQHSLAWCHKTGIVLAAAAKGLARKTPGRKEVAAIDLVKRWFADPATTDVELGKYVGRLDTGFKAIVATLNKGHLVLTDWVPLRGATTQDEISFLMSEAFTFGARSEGMDTIYIERSFFTRDEGGVVHGQKNWARIVVHELTHLVCGTDDVNIGRARYAHYGIGPHAGFPGSAAIRNADSWAFFCADCAGVLTDGERKHALKII
ncbi:MAG TPA: M35 family metallo-endopeptidase [Rhodanobacteraceae bacterium]|jgi:hypothetical protein|nr:M35 family metallo-endopeptidase [Rhodanobacteraceae bacterium]